ncbi:MAG: hypothetical protein PHY77_04325 [Desulfotomaculaceae bacterium]|nr:hypothetical protein [Desulfotomaculaceae bacterium]
MKLSLTTLRRQISGITRLTPSNCTASAHAQHSCYMDHVRPGNVDQAVI